MPDFEFIVDDLFATPMNFLSRLEGFYFHILDIRFYPEETIQMPYWIGAVLRNRFLYAAQQIDTGQGRSLYELLDSFPLSEAHPSFKSLHGGFPKGFLMDCSTLPQSGGKCFLKKGHIYSFSLILIGNCATYFPWLIQALKYMTDEGFGYPMTPLTLVDVSERGGSLLYSGRSDALFPLEHPVVWHEAEALPDMPCSLTFRFKTPVSLISRNRKAKTDIGYQGKLNGFPSFYQFMRSTMYRLCTLNMLYVNPDACFTSEDIDEFVKEAADALLLEADLRMEKRYSTPRVGEKNVYTMCGYTGSLTFGQVRSRYLPLLVLCSFLGIGNDINFGLGQFEVDY